MSALAVSFLQHEQAITPAAQMKSPGQGSIGQGLKIRRTGVASGDFQKDYNNVWRCTMLVLNVLLIVPFLQRTD